VDGDGIDVREAAVRIQAARVRNLCGLYGIIHAPSFCLMKVRTTVPMEAVVKLRQSVEKIFSAGVVLAVVLSGALMAAPSSKPTTSAPAPAKAAPAKPAQPAQRQAQPNIQRPSQQNPQNRPQPGIVHQPIVNAKPVDKSQPIIFQHNTGEPPRALAGGRTEFHNPQTGRTVRTNAQGHVTQIEAHHGGLAGGTIAVNRGPHGQRMVVTGRPGARVVSYGPRRGFVERSVAGRPGYISRTYVVGGRSYAHVYHEQHYHGLAYYRYVPGVYYGPRFYAWALNPWGVPVGYAWGGGFVAPWFGFYAGYFTPYGAYASPDLWLTDYLVAQNLRLAYESQQAGNGDQPPQPSADAQSNANLSPDIKVMIADEVKQQLAAERAAALEPTSSVSQEPAPGSEQRPPALSQRFFVVSSNLDVNTEANQACSLTPGDVIQRKGQDAASDGGVAVEVVSSKPGDCAADSRAAVQLADLQEMHNQFREQLDAGLKMLADNQVRGVPNEPPAGSRPVAEGTADPVQGADAQLVAQETDAAKLEDQVRQDGSTN